MSAAAHTLPTPKNRPMSRRVRSYRSRFLSWLMASGMARSHRGFAGTCRVASAWTGSRGRRRPGRRSARLTRLWPRLPGLCVRLHVGAGGGVSGPAEGLRLEGGGRGRGDLDGPDDASGPARAPEGGGERVDIGRRTSRHARAARGRGERSPARTTGRLSSALRRRDASGSTATGGPRSPPVYRRSRPLPDRRPRHLRHQSRRRRPRAPGPPRYGSIRINLHLWRS